MLGVVPISVPPFRHRQETFDLQRNWNDVSGIAGFSTPLVKCVFSYRVTCNRHFIYDVMLHNFSFFPHLTSPSNAPVPSSRMRIFLASTTRNLVPLSQWLASSMSRGSLVTSVVFLLRHVFVFPWAEFCVISPRDSPGTVWASVTTTSSIS